MKIIILHGLYMHGIVMQPLAHKLEKLGFATHVISYNTVSIDDETLFDEIDAALPHGESAALLGHSLGGLMLKHYLQARQPSIEKISHAIALGSPFQGAAITTPIVNWGLGMILGNAIEHGLTPQEAHWNLPQKLGSIAGTLPIGFLPLFTSSSSQPSDGTVSVEETKIEGMTDHLLTKNTHNSLLASDEVAQQIGYFLQHDHFNVVNRGAN
ncbi:triacylglycerol lipase [Vibrio sp. SM6]|uniref:Triacylglycerol lipase n=1 Tax=Vibrio agarilyticus TaxID=2726741 RepID=A0A7X8TTI4_9VIBR|nr:triacylglycerol lipase [Vibrio agarilyticus]NLS14549.1 triacylglycerol lipase [Vibrio agarilyticus]